MERKTKIILGSLIIFLALFATVIFYISHQKSKTQKADVIQVATPRVGYENLTNKLLSGPISKPLPKVSFSDYKLDTELKLQSTKINTYFLKSSYSQTEVEEIAKKLAFKSPQAQEVGKFTVVTDTAGQSVLNFDRKSGMFFFYTGIGIPLTSNNAVTFSDVEQFLKKNDIADETVTCSVIYKKKSLQDTTFVECHRNWEKIGLPIINILGALNIPPGKRLADLKLAEVSDVANKDDDIIDSSDGKTGLKRPNDFNTITVAISNGQGKVVAITSNMRRIVETQSQDVSKKIKSPETALAELKQGKATISLTLPTGSGFVDLSKVYPGNQAMSNTGTVSDFIIAYLEDSPDRAQQELVPYYIFKGTSRIISGYDVEFVQVIPALDNPGTEKVLGIETDFGSASTIQYATFNFSDEPTPSVSLRISPSTPPRINPTPTPPPLPTVTPSQMPTPTPTEILSPTPSPSLQVSPTPTKPPALTSSCSETFTHEYLLPNGAKLAFNVNWEFRAFMYIPGPSDPADLDSIVERYPQFKSWIEGPQVNRAEMENTIMQQIVGIYLNSVNIGAGKNIIAYCTPLESSVCLINPDAQKPNRCYWVSLGSPNIYVYAKKPTKFSIALNPVNGVYYHDPEFSEEGKKRWNFMTDGNSQLDFGFKVMPRLYYEYDKSPLLKAVKKESFSDKGFIIKKSEIVSFISVLSKRFGLTEKETIDLTAEVSREVHGLKAEYIKISLIPRIILDQYLPVTVTPKPINFERLHLYIRKSVANESSDPLSVQPIKRETTTVVETGVLVDD
ncbi:hypothetical protein A3C23_04675 [Candidatus Roizmanbacteria bacterium RIFCSPHIGHO2_02_FULL_37_13b]|uniref:Uncharacterized protein n=1 Tax=Candidatus Roizmanbacteria bacterium RIFCSPLOWO2_02_FULL_36_11 TaxID=1802071 RepID=A0A1F7JHC4_9BACT|nr:MAG: hypothetical protein A3C23_04675 [Candidatus Roizmanbacteria bacterium RIFCSPHIGHO2_02_FULL_37_13b]OGK55002.1 MAG: hypothetical protein A3H78_00820 [Candidatus Roizmanbacteria bacterium RIFCSPLOWO2_02_FULL_36_11]